MDKLAAFLVTIPCPFSFDGKKITVDVSTLTDEQKRLVLLNITESSLKYTDEFVVTA